MVDICKCNNNTCPRRNKCYRFMVVANEHRQAYSSFVWDKQEGCKYFVNWED